MQKPCRPRGPNGPQGEEDARGRGRGLVGAVETELLEAFPKRAKRSLLSSRPAPIAPSSRFPALRPGNVSDPGGLLEK